MCACVRACVRVCYLKAVVEEEECDLLAAVTRLVSQGDGLHAVDQAAMGRQQVGLGQGGTAERGRESRGEEGWEEK